jgi:hypothetical protein
LFTVTQDKSAASYDRLRKQVMDENVSRMSETLERDAIQNGKPLQDFDALARSFIYGGAQPGSLKRKTCIAATEGDHHGP